MPNVTMMAGLTSAIVVASAIAAFSMGGRQAPATTANRTQVVLLGTGTPRPTPARSGPATAIVANGRAYLVDADPGVVRRAQAAFEAGMQALAPVNLTTAFLTHLHSDHTVGLPDLIFTTWVQGRKGPLNLYGPAGTEAMTGHIMQAWQADIDIRTKGLEQRSTAGLTVRARDITAGPVFADDNIKVTAFPAAHGDVPAFGYRLQTADRTIVISGDTSPGAALVENCRKCDVLIHEVYAEDFRPADMANWLEYRAKHHTTTSQLADVANKTQPGLLILYHYGAAPGGTGSPDERIASEIRRSYPGKVVVGRDLDVY
jgi:ribonuclease BN (tRNA processing enzyme)